MTTKQVNKKFAEVQLRFDYFLKYCFVFSAEHEGYYNSVVYGDQTPEKIKDFSYVVKQMIKFERAEKWRSVLVTSGNEKIYEEFFG